MTRKIRHQCGEQYGKKGMEPACIKGPPRWLTKEQKDPEDTLEDQEEEDGAEEEELVQEKLGLPSERVRMLGNAIRILMGGVKVHPMADLQQDFLNSNKPAPSLEDHENNLKSLEDRCDANQLEVKSAVELEHRMLQGARDHRRKNKGPGRSASRSGNKM